MCIILREVRYALLSSGGQYHRGNFNLPVLSTYQALCKVAVECELGSTNTNNGK